MNKEPFEDPRDYLSPGEMDLLAAEILEGEPETREAVLGEVVQDIRASREDPRTGWFILGVDGYFDVDNACWCAHQEGDAPWTSEYFRLFGTLPDLIALSGVQSDG